MLLALAERRLGLADKLARVFPDRRDPTRVVHSLVDMFRARIFAICCGYEDADDLDHLRSDPAFKLACGRLPDTGRDLCSQPTLSRLENAPRLRDVIRLTYTLVDAWMDSYTETRHQAKSWDRQRRAVARIEVTTLGLDIRFVVTSLDVGSAEWIYDSLYCARGQAENLIKLHKTQLASDRTSCRSALANQVRLVLHTAAYWLMLTVRDAIPKARELATAEFATLRLRLLKIAARVVETTSRIRLAFAAACPEADLIRSLPGALLPLGP
jgi:hypothetical protein